MLPIKNRNEKSQYVKLNKSIYGLRQAGYLWFQNIKLKILQLGAIQCPDDECLFRYEFGGEIIDITARKLVKNLLCFYRINMVK